MTKREKILKIAKKQIGTIGGSKYRQWYNKNVGNIGNSAWPWCAAGLSWCADQAGFSKSEFPPTASAPQMLYNFQNAKRFGVRGSYTPKPADIIIFKYADEQSDASHVGMVEYVKDGYVHTIEFNSGSYYADGCVGRYSYPLSAAYIVGYGAYIIENNKIKTKSKANLYKYAYKDVLGNSSKVLTTIPKGATITYISNSDDGTGWSQIKYKNIQGWIMNSHLKKSGLSKFPEKVLKVKTIATLIKKKKAIKKVTLKPKTKYKRICIIEKGKYKNKKYIGVGRKRYYI